MVDTGAHIPAWSGRRAQAALRKVKANGRRRNTPCFICSQPIDYSLPAGHPMSFEVDEIRPASRGGSVIDPANVAPAHRICNERRGNKSVADMKASAGPRPRDVGCKTSRRW